MMEKRNINTYKAAIPKTDGVREPPSDLSLPESLFFSVRNINFDDMEGKKKKNIKWTNIYLSL